MLTKLVVAHHSMEIASTRTAFGLVSGAFNAFDLIG